MLRHFNMACVTTVAHIQQYLGLFSHAFRAWQTVMHGCTQTADLRTFNIGLLSLEKALRPLSVGRAANEQLGRSYVPGNCSELLNEAG